MFKRIFAEKKAGFDVEAIQITHELKEQLRLPETVFVRVINRYDINVSDDVILEDIIYGIFAEINQDDVYFEDMPKDDDEMVFGVEYQPGQYDIRCDAAEQCIKLLYADADVSVKHAKLYSIKGKISESDIERIKNYIINPVDSRLASLDDAHMDKEEFKSPGVRIEINNFIGFEDQDLQGFIDKEGLAMDLADIRLIRDYFKLEEKRDPTVTELKVLDTYWSDHCRHTTFSSILKDIEFGDSSISRSIKEDYETYLDRKKELGRESKPTTLMDIATMGARYNRFKGLDQDVEISDEINACSYHIKADVDGTEQDYLLMFKNETHNHPTEIEPFGGAATCLGGAIRDPLSGRAYVYQSMRVTGCADPTVPIEQTLHGKLPQRKITTQAAKGFSSYGNQIGLCTGQVKEYYHPDFMAKRMEVGAVLAAAPKENVVRKKPVSGDLIYVIGGRTGRDGIGGASGSSKEHTEASVDTAGSEVQKGNAPEERKLQRLFRNSDCASLIKKCNDFGAGGVSVAIGELADSIDIDLDTLLLKYEGLDATELAISESQERMAVIIDSKDEEEFITYVKSENIEFSKTAVVTDNGRLIMRFRNEIVLDLKRSFIDANGAVKYAAIKVDARPDSNDEDVHIDSFKENLLKCARNLNIASNKGLVEMFDNTIGASTVLMPHGGKYRTTASDVMASKIPIDGTDTITVSLMAHGYDPYLAKVDPYNGAINAVLSNVAKLVCAGADYKEIKLSFQEYFEALRNDPTKWAKPFSALLGALKVQLALGISAIGGKDSMSGSYEQYDVPPTLISFGVAVTSTDRVISNEFKKSGSSVILLKTKKDQYGIMDMEDFKQNLEFIQTCIDRKLVLSAANVGFGGIAPTIMKMCFGNALGFSFNNEINLSDLFKTQYDSMILEIKDTEKIDFSAVNCSILGTTNASAVLVYAGQEVSIAELLPEWQSTLSDVFPEKTDELVKTKEVWYDTAEKKTSAHKIAKPRVFVPIFPGTNCEYDTIKAFEKAGAVCEPFVFKNKSTSDIRESVEVMLSMIRNAQIIAFPGGFSAGDEPDGSGKFIVSVLKNPYISEAVADLMDNRDGLILGICNGFQALVKTGLLPYGRIGTLAEDSPTLTYNKIGRHIARLVNTKLVSNRSVWFQEAELGEVYTVAISHGEGRFVATEQELTDMIRNGQVVAQYCNAEGNVIGDSETNPNGSIYNIEALTSLDGRILGKMGHSERIGKYLYQNCEGQFDQKIFLSGVRYYD